MKYVFAWVGLVVLVGVGLGNVNWANYRRLATHGVQGQGTVIELLPKGHATVRYEYEVGGRRFQGKMHPWEPNPELEQLSVGERVVLYYDPERPKKSVLGDPKPILQNETISIALAAFLIPTFTIVFWAWRTSLKHKKAIAAMVLITSVFVVNGCAGNRNFQPSEVVYDNRGGFAYPGLCIIFYPAGDYEMRRYTDVRGTEDIVERGAYQKDNPLYSLKHAGAERVYHVVVIQGEEYLLDSGTFEDYRRRKDRGKLHGAMRKVK